MPAKPDELRRLTVLDGWRALSILLVLAGHLLPIGPQRWDLNAAVAASGMVMFFTLSGFLITRFLIEDGNIRRFLIRRILRIVPLAWVGALFALLVGGGSTAQVLGTMGFVANLPPWFLLLPAGGHFWSLSVEVQFYAGVAMLVGLAGPRGLRWLPLIGLAVTAGRVAEGQPINIITWFRIDEILAGAALALVYEGWFGERPRAMLCRINPILLLPLVLASAHAGTGALNYVRPYLSALMIGASLYNAPGWLQQASASRVSRYVAAVSFAVYVFHGILTDSWLGSGDKLEKYAKRPLLIGATFALAHLSTYHFERHFIALARRLTARPATPHAV